MADIQIEGLQELIDKYGTDLRPAIRAATFAIGEQLQGIIAVTPPQREGPFQWRSRAEAIAYFAMRTARGLPIKYTRNSDPMSQQLEKSWTTTRSGELDAEVSTRVDYARWVQSAEQQHPGHKATGWITDEQAIDRLQQQDVIKDIITDAIMGALGG